ncbi:iron ABC transporter ATP-binding protein [Alkaliphilus crotonatoxidans]
MIEVKEVSKRYGAKTVLDSVSIQVPTGKITSFIGANGAGKSTLLGLISRLIDKDAGQICLEGRDIGQWNTRELAKKLSILKQANHINIRLTIRELVSFGRFPYSQGNPTEEDQGYIDRAIAYLKLEDIQHQYLDELSGGQRQRAYIAMVLAQNTDYILLDEPLNNLDMKHAVEIMKILRAMVKDLGKTIVLVMHDINFASCYSDYIVAMKQGKVVKTGFTDEIIDQGVLKEIYEMDFKIQEIESNRICIYF